MWIAKTFAVVDEHQAIVARFIVMAISVLYEKIKNGRIDEIEQTNGRQFVLHLPAN